MTSTGRAPTDGTQNASILDHLREHGSINSAEAFKLYGVIRMGARILELKQAGYRITSSNTSVFENGKTRRFKNYALVAQPVGLEGERAGN